MYRVHHLLSTIDCLGLAQKQASVKKLRKQSYSNQGQVCSCSSAQKMELASVGLGLKNLTFHKMATNEEIEAVIYEAFPKLAGLDFEFLRTGSHQKLMVISRPAQGMTITYLRDIVQQSKMYIRPLQSVAVSTVHAYKYTT